MFYSFIKARKDLYANINNLMNVSKASVLTNSLLNFKGDETKLPKMPCDSFERIPDYPYEETELVFRENVEQEATTADKATTVDDVKWYNLIACATLSGVVILAIGFGIGQIRKRKINNRMGGKQDET